MIKNILYSLFLHSLLIVLIYANFKTAKIEELEDLQGINVSMQSLESLQKPLIAKKDLVLPVKTPQKNEVKKVEKIALPKSENKKAEKPKIEKVVKKVETAKAIDTANISPKPEFKKVEEKKEIVQEEKKVEEELLENLNEILDNIENKEEPSEQETLVASTESEIAANDLENINLSAREKFNIQSQLNGCYRRSFNEKDDKFKGIVTLQIKVSQDGTIDFDMDKIIDIARYNNPKETTYKAMMDHVVRALELCSPLRNLPVDKYDVWSKFTVRFGEE